uniref:Uncharacterized protein n=1 Tax=Rhizophagus irregularis (strain DAOM 181602 / DAOM 197198 / MUCL 43194) TaxID=747089 RepID=U9TN20_RHIID
MQQKKNKKHFIPVVNYMILVFLVIVTSIFSTISNQYTSINLKNRNEDNDKESSRLFKKLKMENETIQQEPNVDIIDEDEVYNNNPKFHLEEQDELKISDDDFNKLN